MKNLILLLLILSSAVSVFSQGITPDQVKNSFVKTWKAGYVLMNGMRINAKAGFPAVVFEFRADNSLQTYSTANPNNKTTGTWKYFPDKKRIQVKVSGTEKGFVTSVSGGEMSMELDTSHMGGEDGTEMILMFSPAG